MRRPTQILLALATAFGLVQTIGCGVGATPQNYVDAVAQIWVIGSDKVPYNLRVEFVASLLPDSAAAPKFAFLRVDARPCPHMTCKAATTYVQALVPDFYDVSDLKKIRVHSPSFNGGMTITWKGDGPSAPVDTTPNLIGTDVDVTSAWASVGSMKALGGSCSDSVATTVRHTSLRAHPIAMPAGRPAPYKGGVGLPTRIKSCTKPPRR